MKLTKDEMERIWRGRGIGQESHGCVCEWDGDKLTAWVSTQGVHGTKDGFAQGLKIPGANVRVITQYMGGGFGSKTQVGSEGLMCAMCDCHMGITAENIATRFKVSRESGSMLAGPSATLRKLRMIWPLSSRTGLY